MSDPFSPDQRELDLITLSVQVFLPLAVAVLLLLLPARRKELLRWVALTGCAATLTLGLCRLVDYYNLLDMYSDRNVRSLYHPAARLDSRSEEQQANAAKAVPGRISSFDLVTRRPWVARFDIDYALGLDGVSLALTLLTAVVVLLAVVASWKIDDHLQAYLALLLTLQTGVTGAFLALDLFLFFVFYELMLIPMFVLIGVWGGARRKYAAGKFVVFTLVGSVCLLAAMVALYTVDVRDFVPQERAAGQAVHSFDPATHARVGRAVMLVLTGQEDRLAVRDKPSDADPGDRGPAVKLFAPGVDRAAALARLKAQSVCTPFFQFLLFSLLFVGFAVKVPLVPLHVWLPDAHVEAPTPVSMVLAGVLLKLGGYGLLKFAWPLAPFAASELAWWVGLAGIVSIVWGALAALAQTDIKTLLAYSSVSHMGYVVLGLAAWGADPTYWQWGVNGAVFQMLAHGVTATALFFVVGVIYERAHHRDIDRLGGLTEPMPLFTGLAAVLVFASMALPPLCGFWGEFMAVQAAWAFSPPLAVAAILATVLTAAYLLRFWAKVFLGANPHTAGFPEVTAREIAVLLPLAALAITLGVLPGLLAFNWVEPSVSGQVELLGRLRP